MDIKVFVAEIDEQIAKLQRARAALLSLESDPVKVKPRKPQGSGKTKRRLSADARARISEAQKKRWSTARKSA
jgi:hypothetical protein